MSMMTTSILLLNLLTKLYNVILSTEDKDEEGDNAAVLISAGKLLGQTQSRSYSHRSHVEKDETFPLESGRMC